MFYQVGFLIKQNVKIIINLITRDRTMARYIFTKPIVFEFTKRLIAMMGEGNLLGVSDLDLHEYLSK